MNQNQNQNVNSNSPKGTVSPKLFTPSKPVKKKGCGCGKKKSK